MRTPSDLPPRQRRGRGLSDRGRVVLIAAAVLLVVLLLSTRFLSGFYIDYLWHKSVDRSDVFWGVMGSKITLFIYADIQSTEPTHEISLSGALLSRKKAPEVKHASPDPG